MASHDKPFMSLLSKSVELSPPINERYYLEMQVKKHLVLAQSLVYDLVSDFLGLKTSC